MYRKDQLEFTFIEIISSKKINFVVSCVYNYTNIDVLDFDNYLNQLLGKISNSEHKFPSSEISI